MSKVMDLMKQIAGVLAEYDAKTLESMIASIPARREALAAVKSETFTGKYASNSYAYAQIEAVGGKGWLELLRNGNNYVTEQITKKEAAKAAARNAKIAVSLDKAGISNIGAFESSRTNDGFQGRWTVETDKGQKSVFISVLIAGGYNIQCLHMRVLVKVI